MTGELRKRTRPRLNQITSNLLSHPVAGFQVFAQSIEEILYRGQRRDVASALTQHDSRLRHLLCSNKSETTKWLCRRSVGVNYNTCDNGKENAQTNTLSLKYGRDLSRDFDDGGSNGTHAILRFRLLWYRAYGGSIDLSHLEKQEL